MLKKIFKILGIIIGIILLLLIVIVIMGYDGNDINNPKVVEDDKSTLTVVSNKLYEKTKDVKTEKEANITFNEEELEYLLYPIFMAMNDELNGFKFTGVNIDVNDGEYFIKLSGKAIGVYNTVLYAKLNFSFNNEIFEIKLDSVKLGRLGLTGLGKVLLMFVSEKEVERDLAESGIYLDLDKNKLAIRMTLDDIEQTLTKQTKEDNKELISLLLDIFLANNNLLELNLGDDNLIGAIIHLDNAKYDSTIHGELKYNYDFDDIKNKIESLLSSHIINSEKVSPVSNFLIKGYNHIDDETKEEIKNIDFTSIGIANKNSYEGIIDRSDLSMSSYMTSLFVGKSPLEITHILKDGIVIPDTTLTGLVQSFDFIGSSFAFSNEEGKVGYFVLEQLDFTCLEKLLKIDLVANINGLRICVEVETECPDSDGLVITGVVKKLLIGNYDLSDDQKTKLLRYLRDTFKDTNWINANPDKEEITLDFSEAMSDAISQNSILSNLIKNSIDLSCKTIIKEGYIAIKYSMVD